MALFRFVRPGNKHRILNKLLGTGRSGSFDLHPNLQQWAIMDFSSTLPDIPIFSKDYDLALQDFYGSFIFNWWKRFNCETWTIILEVKEGHGTWNGREIAKGIRGRFTDNEPVAVLTRATIRLHKLRSFWTKVPPVSRQFFRQPGVLFSLGIGESPLVHQATFSIWESLEKMRAFAYNSIEHRDVIQKTRKENWYKEEMFLRLSPILTAGSLKGVNPFPLTPEG